ncbi:MAG: hypothetical protein HZY74_01995 [Brevundimonas sp.]|nr:MAG: hypothetical protein HZY74_01995 [Brevundimonas sp.]
MVVLKVPVDLAVSLGGAGSLSQDSAQHGAGQDLGQLGRDRIGGGRRGLRRRAGG